ncbi:outer-membrane lipoprotein carrier protein LolA [Clostridiaceae bacterium 35-E11]
MKKKAVVWIIFMILMITGCSPKNNEDLLYDAQKQLNKMESYQCQVEITSIGNKGSQKYVMKQWFKKPNMYKLEVVYPENLKGKMTIFDGKKAWIYHPVIEQTWLIKDFVNAEEQNMFLGYFVKNCLNSEEVHISRETIENEEYLVITTNIPGNHAYFSKERVWLHIDSRKPFMMQTFDRQDQLRIKVKYDVFEYNPRLEDQFFQFKKGIIHK